MFPFCRSVIKSYLSTLILKSDEYLLNGQKVNIVSSLFSLGFTSLLIVSFGLVGALVVIFFVTLSFVLKASWFKHNVDKQSLIKLGKYSAMALTVPVSHLIVRNYIGENLSYFIKHILPPTTF